MNTTTSPDGTTIAYDKTGDGPSIILVGGAFQYRSFDPNTAKLAELLSPNFTVYTYDRRGRGESTDTLPYAVEHEIEDLDSLIAEAGGSAYVFGMSSGGALALAAAARGSKITKLAVYEPPFRGPDAPQLPDGFSERLTNLLSANDYDAAVTHFLTKGVGVPEEMIANMRQSPMWQGFTAVAPTLAYDNTVMGDSRIPIDTLRAISLPVLVIDGGKSADWVSNAAETTAKALPNSHRQTLEGQDHNVDPTILVRALKAFFV